MGYFAVIDTETNWDNEVMSIGVVIADHKTYEKVDELYCVFDPEYQVGGMFSHVLPLKKRKIEDALMSRPESMEKIMELLSRYKVKQLYAYNASFDKNLLHELASYAWHDIMRIAAYRQYNDRIPPEVECCRTGRMKSNYGVEPMMQMLSGNYRYMEVHNALYDAIDELEIMRLLGKSLNVYDAARL